jgi:hypothetical protein
MARAQNRVVLLVVFLALATPAVAAAQANKCAAAKQTCVAKKVQGLLACHAAADKKGVAVDPACLAKVRAKFDGGANPSKGCIAKLEAKQNPAKPATVCPTTGDSVLLESQVDAFVDAIACQLTSTGPCASASGERCENAKLIAPGNFGDQSTVGFQFDYDACGLPGAFDGPDRVYAVVVPAGKTLGVTATPVAGSDGVNLALYEGAANCGSTAADHCASVDTAGGTEQVHVQATNANAASVVYFVLAGAGGLDPVEFDLLVTIGN